jgi:hypothetical protein
MTGRLLPPGWQRLSQGLESRPLGLDVPHRPGCARPKPQLRARRTRADGAILRELRCPECGARRVWADDIEIDLSTGEPIRPRRVKPGPEPMVSREAVLGERQRRRSAGLPYGDRALKDEFGVSERTIRRARTGH